MEGQQLLLIVMAVGIAAVLIALLAQVNVMKRLVEFQKGQQEALPHQQAPAVSVASPVPVAAPAVASAPAVSGGITGEILAVIAAAAYTVYGVEPSAIQSVTVAGQQPVMTAAAPVAAVTAPRAVRARSAWATAGVLENTSTF